MKLAKGGVTVSVAAFEVNDGWRRWIAENHLLGTSAEAIVDVLVGQGLAQNAAQEELDLIRRDKNLVAAGWIVQRLRKLESLLESQQRMRRLDPGYGVIARRSGMSGEQFLVDYYAANSPVVLDDVADCWPALTRWTPEYLVRCAGSEIIEVMAARDSDERYEQNLEAHRLHIPFHDYVANVEAAGDSNDTYLVANNHFLERSAAAPLLADITIDERFLDPACGPSQMFFWYGPAGTVTPMHHDTSNVLLAQVRGSKQVVLVPALEAHRMYNEVAVYSPVDPEAADHSHHPLFAGATAMTVTLHPGDALFIPVGWWHHVRSLEVSISVSFTNFRFPNSVEWALPHIVRR